MRIRSPLLTKLISRSVGAVLRLMFKTLEIDYYRESDETHPTAITKQSFLYSVWHDAIMIPIAMKNRYPDNSICALVSRHQDGSYLDEFLKCSNIRAIRGSSNRGGVQALRELMREPGCSHVWITPDGPRGPRRVLKEGIVFLASHTGMPIVPIVSICNKEWRVQGKWTDMAVPKPFSKAIFLMGRPLHIPPDLSRNGLEHYRAFVQSEMERVENLALQLARGEDPATPVRRAA